MSMYNFFLQVEDNSVVSPPHSDLSPVVVNILNLDDESTVFNQTEFGMGAPLFVEPN